MKKIRLAGATLFLTLFARLCAGELTWLTDLGAAQAQAAREHKLILADFTGSTWCPPCIALHDEVLTQAEFAAFARDYVLVQLDYPRKSERTPEKIAARPALKRLMDLKEHYGVTGFPTVLILDAEGRSLGGALGYDGHGPAAWLAQLQRGKAAGKLAPPQE